MSALGIAQDEVVSLNSDQYMKVRAAYSDAQSEDRRAINELLGEVILTSSATDEAVNSLIGYLVMRDDAARAARAISTMSLDQRLKHLHKLLPTFAEGTALLSHLHDMRHFRNHLAHGSVETFSVVDGEIVPGWKLHYMVKRKGQSVEEVVPIDAEALRDRVRRARVLQTVILDLLYNFVFCRTLGIELRLVPFLAVHDSNATSGAPRDEPWFRPTLAAMFPESKAKPSR